MPIYEYKCPKCGVFEATKRITEPPLKRCPTCKSKVERLLSRTSFVLKGSGWYATDYARSGSGSAGSDSTSTESSANGAPSAASDSTKAESASKTDAPSTPSKPSKPASAKSAAKPAD